MSSPLPLHSCNFFSLSSLSYFIPSPFHLIPFPPCPRSLVSHSSHPPPLFLSPPFLLTFFFFFLYCSSSHTPSCCSKSLKGTELVGVVAVVIEALAVPAELWVGWADILSGCTKTLRAHSTHRNLIHPQIHS